MLKIKKETITKRVKDLPVWDLFVRDGNPGQVFMLKEFKPVDYSVRCLILDCNALSVKSQMLMRETSFDWDITVTPVKLLSIDVEVGTIGAE